MASTALCHGFLTIVASTWFYQVAKTVPEPYLDEVFHVRQALTYFSNRFRVWDPKITTPPGLYVFSYPGLFVLQVLGTPGSQTLHLRALNLFETVFGLYFATGSLSTILWKHRNGISTSSKNSLPKSLIDHTALNIALFPPLFFFSSLYYTDIMSVVTVLHAYEYFIKDDTGRLVMYSLMALSLRQTNIFWTAVWLGGLEVVKALKSSDEGRKKQRDSSGSPQSWAEALSQSWGNALLYDPLVCGARFEDYFKCAFSLILASASHISIISTALLPYISILLVFGGFVVWNGGVVLGDKSNHVATLHVPQMLYIWPYIFFFSFPLLAPYLISLLIQVPFLKNLLPNQLVRLFGLPSRTSAPRFLIALPFIFIMSAIVYFNTIVHPFTLADNRHYMFYVFRLLLRHPAIKYLVTPLYLACGWATIQVLGGTNIVKELDAADGKYTKMSKKAKSKSSSSSSKGVQKETSESRDQGQHVSFVLIFLVSTTLSLITAPLVEPRYFIIPWCIWRLNIPVPKARNLPVSSSSEVDEYSRLLMVVETVWYLVINFGTAYMFLYRPFTWPSEPGKLQRFMW